jgi:hypothetical protein
MFFKLMQTIPEAVTLFRPTFVDLGYICTCGDELEYIEVLDEEEFCEGYYTDVCKSCSSRPEVSDIVGVCFNFENECHVFFIEPSGIVRPQHPSGHEASEIVERWVSEALRSTSASKT